MSEQRSEYKIGGRPATIFRTVKDKDNPYVMIDRRPIDNNKLSFKAKGILIYLLSRPDGWEVNMVDLVARSTEGLAAVKSGVRELQAAGHLRHLTIKEPETGKISAHLWEVYEAPQIENQLVDNPPVGVLHHKVENHNVDKPQCGKSHASINNLSNKELSINTTTTTETVGSIFKAYENEIGLLTPHVRDLINNAIDNLKFPAEWIIDAIHEAAGQNKRNWAYCQAILKRWSVEGKQSRNNQPSGLKYPNKTVVAGLNAGETLAEHNARVIKELVHERPIR